MSGCDHKQAVITSDVQDMMGQGTIKECSCGYKAFTYDIPLTDDEGGVYTGWTTHVDLPAASPQNQSQSSWWSRAWDWLTQH